MTLLKHLAISALLFLCAGFFPALAAPAAPALPNASPADARALAAAVADTQRGIDTRDLALFERHVAVDALLRQSATAFVNTLASGKGAQLPPALALIAATATTPEAKAALVDILTSETGRFARYGVTSGRFAGKPVPGPAPGGLIAPLLTDVSTGRKELSLAGPARRDGQSLIAPLNVKDYGNDHTYRVEMRFASTDTGWKAVEILNLDALMARLRKEAAENAAP